MGCTPKNRRILSALVFFFFLWGTNQKSLFLLFLLLFFLLFSVRLFFGHLRDRSRREIFEGMRVRLLGAVFEGGTRDEGLCLWK